MRKYISTGARNILFFPNNTQPYYNEKGTEHSSPVPVNSSKIITFVNLKGTEPLKYHKF